MAEPIETSQAEVFMEYAATITPVERRLLDDVYEYEEQYFGDMRIQPDSVVGRVCKISVIEF